LKILLHLVALWGDTYYCPKDSAVSRACISCRMAESGTDLATLIFITISQLLHGSSLHVPSRPLGIIRIVALHQDDTLVAQPCYPGEITKHDERMQNRKSRFVYESKQ
jgi:hypothetical protein